MGEDPFNLKTRGRSAEESDPLWKRRVIESFDGDLDKASELVRDGVDPFLTNAIYRLSVEDFEYDKTWWDDYWPHLYNSVEESKVTKEWQVRRKLLHEMDIDQEADGYVYVIELSHAGETWYYVGETGTVDSLITRVNDHRNFSQSHPTQMNGQYVLNDLGEGIMEFANVERVEEVYVDPGVPKRARLHEIERRMAYRVAIEYQTENVLGGK